ncbi:MAG: hypothetical protein HOV86_24360 [Thermoactinospora sp.]|nr:hypothetical protein [Thermoactinospora sp.]
MKRRIALATVVAAFFTALIAAPAQADGGWPEGGGPDSGIGNFHWTGKVYLRLP